MNLAALFPGLSWPAILLLGVVALLAGVLKAWIGIGSGILVVSVASLLVSPQYAAAMWAVLNVGSDVGTLHLYWGQWERRGLRWLLAAAGIGGLVGSLILGYTNPDLMRKVIGFVIIVAVLADVVARRLMHSLQVRPNAPGNFAAGLAVGLIQGISTGSGPVLAAYLMAAGLTPAAFVATMSTVSMLVNTIKLGVFSAISLLTLPLILAGVLLMPVHAVGLAIGRWLNQNTSPARFRVLLVPVLLFMGLLLLV